MFFMEFCRVYFSRWFFGSFQKEEKEGRRHGKEKTQISLTLAENESVIRTWCENCDDIQIRPMKLGKTGGTGALLIYVEVAVSCVMLKDSVIGKLLNRLMEVPEADIPGVLSENQLGISDTLEFDTLEDAFASMLAGNAVLFVDGYDCAVKIGSKGYPNMGVQKAESEKVLRGSNEGFSDSVKTNTALVRKRLRTTDLKVEEIHFGARSDTVLALVYEKELIYPKFLEEVKQQIAGWEVDGVLTAAWSSSSANRSGNRRSRASRRPNGRTARRWRFWTEESCFYVIIPRSGFSSRHHLTAF